MVDKNIPGSCWMRVDRIGSMVRVIRLIVRLLSDAVGSAGSRSYLPMQNVEKMRARMSSAVVWPVSVSSACKA